MYFLEYTIFQVNPSGISYLYIFRNPPHALTASAHYERLVDVFGGKGFYCVTIPELQAALKEALTVTILNHPTHCHCSNFTPHFLEQSTIFQRNQH